VLCNRPSTSPLCTAPAENWSLRFLHPFNPRTHHQVILCPWYSLYSNGSRQKGGAARRFAHQNISGCRPSLMCANRKGAGSIIHDHLPHQAQLRLVQCSIPAISCEERTATGFHARAASRKSSVNRRFVAVICISLLLTPLMFLCSTSFHSSTTDRA
jgi:hypothetical protein